jgi:hypothetical protein
MIDEIGGDAHEMVLFTVLNMVLRFWCQNGGSSRICKLTGFTSGHPTRKRAILTNPMVVSYELGFHRYFCCVEKRLRVYGESGRCFRVDFQDLEILPNDISIFGIERTIC